MKHNRNIFKAMTNNPIEFNLNTGPNFPISHNYLELYSHTDPTWKYIHWIGFGIN
jgi:hypothetical protein